MKKFFCTALALCLILSTLATPVLAEREDVDIDVGEISRIDINGDGVFNMKDIILSAKKAAGWDVDSLISNAEALDANQDNVVNLSDTVSLAREYLGWKAQ